MSRRIKMLIPVIALIGAQLACTGPGCPMISFVVAGSVADSKGNAISSASVTVKSDHQFDTISDVSLTSDGSGNFETDLLFSSTCSKFTVTVSKDVYEAYATFYYPHAPGTHGLADALNVTLRQADE